MIMSSMAETCKRELFSYCKILKKSHLRQKFTHQKKYKNSEKITKKCIVSVPNVVPNNLVMFNHICTKNDPYGS